jgi:hypothetical protein
MLSMGFHQINRMLFIMDSFQMTIRTIELQDFQFDIKTPKTIFECAKI